MSAPLLQVPPGAVQRSHPTVMVWDRKKRAVRDTGKPFLAFMMDKMPDGNWMPTMEQSMGQIAVALGDAATTKVYTWLIWFDGGKPAKVPGKLQKIARQAALEHEAKSFHEFVELD